MNCTPHNWRDARRLQAWRLQQKGWPQRQIAEALGVSEGAVSPWLQCAGDGVAEALRHRTPPGAPSRSADEPRAPPTLLQQGPAAYGFRGELWTRGRTAAVMRLTCGVSSRLTHLDRLCQAIRWSLQKPARRSGDGARARRDLACHQKGAEDQQQSLFFREESGFYPLPSVVRTCAPVGHTPILRDWWARDHLSAIRAISPAGKRCFPC